MLVSPPRDRPMASRLGRLDLLVDVPPGGSGSVANFLSFDPPPVSNSVVATTSAGMSVGGSWRAPAAC